MGATNFYSESKCKDARTAFRNAVEEANSYYGHQEGYSGEVNSKDGFVEVTNFPHGVGPKKGYEYIWKMVPATYHDDYKVVESNLKEGVWQMQGGTKVKIEDMETSHLRNTIRFLGRKEQWPFRNMYIEKMEAEMQRRV